VLLAGYGSEHADMHFSHKSPKGLYKKAQGKTLGIETINWKSAAPMQSRKDLTHE
jgi:hypothetical protein